MKQLCGLGSGDVLLNVRPCGLLLLPVRVLSSETTIYISSRDRI